MRSINMTYFWVPLFSNLIVRKYDAPTTLILVLKKFQSDDYLDKRGQEEVRSLNLFVIKHLQSIFQCPRTFFKLLIQLKMKGFLNVFVGIT